VCVFAIEFVGVIALLVDLCAFSAYTLLVGSTAHFSTCYFIIAVCFLSEMESVTNHL